MTKSQHDLKASGIFISCSAGLSVWWFARQASTTR